MKVQLTKSDYDSRIFIASITVEQYEIDKFFRKTKFGYQFKSVDEDILDKALSDLKLRRIKYWKYKYLPYAKYNSFCKLYECIVISDRDI